MLDTRYWMPVTASAEREAGYWMLNSEFRMLVIDGEWKRHLKSKI